MSPFFSHPVCSGWVEREEVGWQLGLLAMGEFPSLGCELAEPALLPCSRAGDGPNISPGLLSPAEDVGHLSGLGNCAWVLVCLRPAMLRAL